MKTPTPPQPSQVPAWSDTAIEQEIDHILKDCVIECNDGPTPWCFDENSSETYQFRNRIMKILSQVESAAYEKGREAAAKEIEQAMRERVKGGDHHEYLDYLDKILAQYEELTT